MPLVAGIDSSTQSCKVVICDADSGRIVRHGTAPHPPGSEVDPERWWDAVGLAVERAGGLDDVAGMAVAGQQHGMICLDERGRVIRPALLWNDTRSAAAAEQLIVEFGDGDPVLGAHRWAEAVGTVPVTSLTVSKLRWLIDHEPDNAALTAAVALPHDWLTWRLRGSTAIQSLITDRSDASGTGYFDATSGAYRRDLLALALRRDEAASAAIFLPTVHGPREPAGRACIDFAANDTLVGPGCGDNAAAALGLGVDDGDVFVSLGTSGVAAAVSSDPVNDPSGAVAGFADATGGFLPLACTLNATRILDATAAVLGVDAEEFSALALAARPGAGGLVQVPYLEGERTPNLPDATGVLYGMTLSSLTRENLARAAVEGMLCLMADAMETLRAQNVTIDRVTLVGGGARSKAVREIAPSVLGVPVVVPEPGEYVARGAARQAAWTLTGENRPQPWPMVGVRTYTSEHRRDILDRYREFAAISACRAASTTAL
ncbi:xylulokinase [Nocardia sp. NBC_01377]|uniref:xylulokinase n=1 Tax=Nocardia sp. NBC_01377 TaxID=2903595 RepID=UPI00324D71E3